MKHFINALTTFVLFNGPVLADISAKCIHASAHDSVTILLVDRTDLMKDVPRFSRLMGVVKESIQPNERFIAAVVTDHANSSRLLLDVVKPQSSAWKSLLKSRKETREFGQCLDEFQSTLAKAGERYKQSAILETLAFASEILKGDASPRKRIVLYSDMLQNSEMVSFYKPKLLDAKITLSKAKRGGLVKDLSSVNLFFVTNSGTLGEKKDRQIEKFWRSYANATKSSLRLYGPALTNFAE